MRTHSELEAEAPPDTQCSSYLSPSSGARALPPNHLPGPWSSVASQPRPVDSLEPQAAGSLQTPSLLLPNPGPPSSQIAPVPSSRAGLVATGVPSSPPLLMGQFTGMPPSPTPSGFHGPPPLGGPPVSVFSSLLTRKTTACSIQGIHNYILRACFNYLLRLENLSYSFCISKAPRAVLGVLKVLSRHLLKE